MRFSSFGAGLLVSSQLLVGSPCGVMASTEVQPVSVEVTRRASLNEFELILNAPVFETKRVFTQVSKPITRWKCDFRPPSFNTEYDKYLNAPVADKVRLLVRALDGVTYDQAVAIVQNAGGYFVSRPATWDLFVREALRAEMDLSQVDGSMRGFFLSVVVVNGNSNFQKLGYAYPGYVNQMVSTSALKDIGDDGDFNDPAPSPNPTPTSNEDGDFNDETSTPPPPPPPPAPPAPAPAPEAYDCRWVTETVTVWDLVEQKVRTGEVSKVVSLVFNDAEAPLLSWERETVVVTWNGVADTVLIDQSRAYNNYAVTSDSAGRTYTLVAESRKRIAPSLSDFEVNYSGGQLTVRDIRVGELRGLGDYELEVSFDVVKVTGGGGCGGKSEAVGARRSGQSADGTLTFNVTEGLEASKKGESIQITNLSIARKKTKYFDEGALAYSRSLGTKIRK